MQVTKVSNFSAGVNPNYARTQNFNGHWESQVWGAPYPYEDSKVNVNLYVADVDESFDEIRRNFLAKAQGNRDIFKPAYGNIYTIGGTNYFTDLSKNREAQKRNYTISSEYKLKNKKWVEAVEDKLKIANILKEQGPKMEKDKFLTEEGIRTIFHAADNDSKMTIAALVSEYNVDMAKGLLRTFKKMK